MDEVALVDVLGQPVARRDAREGATVEHEPYEVKGVGHGRTSREGVVTCIHSVRT